MPLVTGTTATVLGVAWTAVKVAEDVAAAVTIALWVRKKFHEKPQPRGLEWPEPSVLVNIQHPRSIVRDG